MSPITANDTAGLVWGGVAFLTLSYALSRLIRGSKHGYSIRLQLFFALFCSSMMSTTLIGWWAINRIEARAALLFVDNGLSTEMIEQFFIDFGAKTGLILGLQTLIAAGGAWALGWGLAAPIEKLASAAEGVSIGGDISSLPRPPGREVRRLREALVSMHEALEDRRLFERFITDLSHDLKNPVAAIKASVEVLQAGAADEKKSREHFIRRVDEASERLNVMLSDFLSLARLESRGLRFDPEPLSPLRCLQSAIRSQEGLAQLKEIEIRCCKHSSLEIETWRQEPKTSEDTLSENMSLCGSHKWLSRAFENLISNAIKFGPVGSTVSLDFAITRPPQSREVSSRDGNDQNTEAVWVLLVSDEGTGVPHKFSDQIFNRFVSKPRELKASSKHEHMIKTPEGTGLGLAIVKQVIEAHKGQIILLGEDDQRHFKRQVSGAQFLVSLPLNKTGESSERS